MPHQEPVYTLRSRKAKLVHERVMKFRSKFFDGIVAARRVHAIGKERDDEFPIRIDPQTGAGKS